MAALKCPLALFTTTGTYKASQFSASETVAAVHQEAANTQSLFLDHKQILVLGEVRYLHNKDNINTYITDEFYGAVMTLPVKLFGLTAEDKQVYLDFLNEWGTVSVL